MSLMRCSARVLIALPVVALLVLGGCKGVDPLLANPPPVTRPDVVMETPAQLRSDLTASRQTEERVRALFAQPLWSDALAQDEAAFRDRLARERPALADRAGALRETLGTLFVDAASLSHTTRQIELRLQALDDIRARTGFQAYVDQRRSLYNDRAEARRQQSRHAGEAGRYGAEAGGYRSTINNGRVERIDYVNSSGRTVYSQYTAAHDEKQRARLLLPFANSAARDAADAAASEAEKAQRLDIVIGATRNRSMEQVEAQIFDESDRITLMLWPRLDQGRRKVTDGLQTLQNLTATNTVSR